jgi:hypothetical protein
MKLLSDTPLGVDRPHKIVCQNGHEFFCRPSDFKDGHGCNVCAGNSPISLETLLTCAKEKGWALLSPECRGWDFEYEWRCDQGHIFRKHYGNMGTGCLACSSGFHTSKGQQEIADFLKGIGVEAELNNRSVIAPYEIDIFANGVGIEFCGMYWHGEKFAGPKARVQHLDKLMRCDNKDVRLITVFESEWIHRPEAVKGYLASVFGKAETKIGARGCEIKEVSNKCGDFLEKYHILGAGNMSGAILFGLEHESQTVSMISLRPSSDVRRGAAEDGVWELTRYCLKPKVMVTGGFQRLLSHFCEKYAPKKIVTFSDRRWSAGQMYARNGFVKTGTTPPSYWYFQGNGPMQHKSRYRKDPLAKMGGIGGTEWEMARSVKLDRVWDCGLDRWVKVL